MKLPNDYIIFDIETTGFSGTKDKCLEIGALKVVDGKVISTFEVMMDHGIAEEQYIPHINGITIEEITKKGLMPDVAFDHFRHFIAINLPIIGHNIIKFDIPFLDGNFPGFGKIDFDIYDTAVIYKAMKCGIEMNEDESFSEFAKRVLGAKQYYGVKYSMDTAIQEFGLDKTNITQHRALGDCYLTNQLYQILCQKQTKKERSSSDLKKKPTILRH